MLVHLSMNRSSHSVATAWAALSLVLLLALLLALGPGGSASASSAPAPSAGDVHRGCLPDEGGARRGLVAWINRVRAGEGLDPLLVHPYLCAVAQGRAESMASEGSVQSTDRAIQGVSRKLLAEGYEAHRWTERAILGYDEPVRMAERWSYESSGAMTDTVLGPYEEVGVGVAPSDDGTVISLLFAVPRLSELVRVSEPLADLSGVRSTALARVNRARQEEGRSPVAADPRLDAAAQRYAELMLSQGFYGHVTPEGGTPRSRAEAAGYGQFVFLGENIAQGLFTPDEVVERWLDSPDHRRNILEARATETGLGVAYGDTPRGFRVLWVQLFARPR